MKSLVLIIFIVISNFLGCTYELQNKKALLDDATIVKKNKVYAQSNLKVLLFSDALSPSLMNYLKANKIETVGYINDVQFLDPNKKFAFSSALLDKELQRAFPDNNASGMAYIDLEAPYLDHLMNSDVNSLEFIKSKQLFLDVLAYVKRERPNVKWGYYALPFSDYWNRTKDFYAKNDRACEIIKNSDVLFPSIYIFYNYLSFSTENKGYLQDNTQEAIKVAKKYNKKVYPMVMSRYHPSNAKVGDKSIALDDFDFYIKTIAQTSYQKQKVDGILLWNADGYFSRTNVAEVVKDTRKSGKDFQTFYNGYLESYLKVLLKYSK